jgi:LacI family transcriptional regulator
MVVNELMPESRSALSDRYLTMVIATPLRSLCADLVQIMTGAAIGSDAHIPGQHFLEPHLYLPESV